MFKSILKSISLCGIQPKENTKKPNLNKILTFQNSTLIKLSSTTLYVSNLTPHADLKPKTLNEEAKLYFKRFYDRITTHTNSIIKNLASATIPDNISKWFSVSKDLLCN